MNANDVYAKGPLGAMRPGAELIYDSDGYSYENVDCANPQIASFCKEIEDKTGRDPIVNSSQGAYCAYARLSGGSYYCINSLGEARETTVFPGGSGYRNGVTFDCP